MILNLTPQPLKKRAQGQLLFAALRNHCPDDIIMFWLKRYPVSANCLDESSRFRTSPLEMSLLLRRSSTIISALLRLNPDVS